MTWTADIMPDDALDPDSLVGRMLNPEPEFTAEELEMIAAPWSYLEPPPLWRAMRRAYDQSSVPTALADAAHPETGNCLTDRYGYAAEIEALRDWLLPEEPEPEPTRTDRLFGPAREAYLRWHERQRLRQLLTEQARIAIGDQ